MYLTINNLPDGICRCTHHVIACQVRHECVAVRSSFLPTITRLPGTTSHKMTDTYLSLDAQIDLIETEIARLRAQARELRVRRNALAPFARLPAEVVHFILDIVMQNTLLEQDPYAPWSRSNPEVWYASQERIGWTNILGMRTFLRDLAIAYPATVEPGARGVHWKFWWPQPITAFSGGRIGGGGPLVVHPQPAQLVVRW
jgi:hypothetical protein